MDELQWPLTSLCGQATPVGMTQTPNILCIGSVLWDIIGRSSTKMRAGSDVAGHITRIPGGVAMNIAMTLVQFGLTPALLSSVGRDAEGDDLVAKAQDMGLITDHLYRPTDLATDVYMAIEGAGEVIAAIADAHCLEKAGDKILRPLMNGALSAVPFSGTVVLDGNLTLDLLETISTSPLFAAAHLCVAPASPGKADRLLPFLTRPAGTLYLNLEEANLLLGTDHADAATAAMAIRTRGAGRVLVTDGAQAAAFAQGTTVLTATPPEVHPVRLTGAGDTFMAAHIASEVQGMAPQAALERALNAAATYVSGETPS